MNHGSADLRTYLYRMSYPLSHATQPIYIRVACWEGKRIPPVPQPSLHPFPLSGDPSLWTTSSGGVLQMGGCRSVVANQSLLVSKRPESLGQCVSPRLRTRLHATKNIEVGFLRKRVRCPTHLTNLENTPRIWLSFEPVTR